MWRFVGRTEALARLAAAMPVGPGRHLPGVILISGEAGMGKTALLARVAQTMTAQGAQVGWGACWDGVQVPAFWPWTQVLRSLGAELPSAEDRMRIFDAVARLLAGSVAQAPVVIIIDDLQWGDPSTVELLRFLAGQTFPGALLLVGAHRPAEGLADLTKVAIPVPLAGLSASEIGELVSADLAGVVYQRSAGHPFFARELSQALLSGADIAGVPGAVREVIARRVARVSSTCARMLEAAAVAGPLLAPDVLAEVTEQSATRVSTLIGEGEEAGLLARGGFGHDLYRESIYASLSAEQRLDLHHRIGVALVRRGQRGGEVFAAELARHFAAAAPIAGARPAIEWARQAAAADSARFAFAEAAGHLRRARLAAITAPDELPAAQLVDLLTWESADWLRAGDTGTARGLLEAAWEKACGIGDPARMGEVALGMDALGARFATRRSSLISVLERARSGLAGTATALEAQVTAALARQLQHSIPAERPRAAPLAEQAVSIARSVADPATLASSLLALHDSLWTPGRAAVREGIAAEIADIAARIGNPERYAQALLLVATAQLEQGSPAFRTALAEYLQVTAELRQPRHDYLLQSRRAALALLDGHTDEGEGLCLQAALFGESINETDAGNVRMSQLLEVARLRNEPKLLRRMARDAVRWWVGAPVHAHAVAAGFLARAGDLSAARQELDTVLALPDWREDRSYLWSVFVGELTTAAIALDDRPLCTELLEALLPVAETCAVNGAMVCFMGAHAHRVGLLYGALEQPDQARQWLSRAAEVHRAVGAQAWAVASDQAIAQLGTPELLRRDGDLWHLAYQGRTAHLRDVKGLHDLQTLLRRPGRDIPAIDLAAAAVTDVGGDDPALDRRALNAYRQRLSELQDEMADAREQGDLGRADAISNEREQLVEQLRRSTRPSGQARPLGIGTAERARKAVTARIRDAIRRIDQVLPELGGHLDRCVRTGNLCRYDPAGSKSH